MSEISPKKARKPPATAWKPGQSGNPSGKPKGAKNKVTLMAQSLIDGQAGALVKKAIELALAGDGPVLRAILDRLCPAKRDAPILVTLPKIESAADLPAVTAAVIDAVAKGQLTPAEAQAVAGLVEAHRRTLETADIEVRLAALEAREEDKQ
ncbi:MAG: DUF5681 domain-containing protein [Solidesulfovibrio sp. DCME]|uniref:DUF5681 domain-containing protein n=1 Tax=Solidesulfovibrio sp. DCME TaxID=3447380 RepID=UPI003D1243AD